MHEGDALTSDLLSYMICLVSKVDEPNIHDLKEYKIGMGNEWYSYYECLEYIDQYLLIHEAVKCKDEGKYKKCCVLDFTNNHII